MNRLNDRIYGILFGQAIGDALGLAAEGMSCDRVATTYPNGVNGYADIIQDDFRKRWAPGEWTDDTNQMLCILDSLLERRTVDPNDIAARFVRWFHHDGRGIGRHTYNILRMPQYAQRPYEISEFFWKFSRCNSAPNGALMRTCITGIWDYRDEAAVYENTENICRLTHFEPAVRGFMRYHSPYHSKRIAWTDGYRIGPPRARCAICTRNRGVRAFRISTGYCRIMFGRPRYAGLHAAHIGGRLMGLQFRNGFSVDDTDAHHGRRRCRYELRRCRGVAWGSYGLCCFARRLGSRTAAI